MLTIGLTLSPVIVNNPEILILAASSSGLNSTVLFVVIFQNRVDYTTIFYQGINIKEETWDYLMER